MNNVALIGHNKPPSDLEILQQKLSEKYAEARKVAHDLASQANAQPKLIETEQQAADITDIIREITKHDKALEGSRVAEKETYLAAGRAVDAFFKKGQDLIGTGKTILLAVLTTYQNKKAAEERAAREEAARVAQIAAQEAAARALAEEQAAKPAEAAITLNQAVIAEQDAYKAKLAAEVKPAELARTYGSSGARASLKTQWVGEIISRDDIELEALRAHFTEEALQKAINAFVSTGGRNLRGVRIFEDSKSVVR